MKATVHPCPRLDGKVVVPGDKSISHRALMFNALGRGRCDITNLGPGADVRSTAQCLQQMGVDVVVNGTEASVEGVGLDGLKAPSAPLDCGNSGTSMRLLSGIIAGAQIPATLVGDEGLSRRPMRRVLAPLRAMGANAHGDSAPTGKEVAPLRFEPAPLRGAEHILPIASAQVKSACLLAGLYADGETRVSEPHPSRDHTERMLRAMGVNIHVDAGGAVSVEKHRRAMMVPRRLRVPGDPSSAAFLLAAAAIAPSADLVLEFVSANPTRTGFLQALLKMGATVERTAQGESAGDPVEDLHITSASRLSPITLGTAEIPALVDEVPVLAVVATQAHGKTVISGAEDLRHKESDRLAVTAQFLNHLGADVEEQRDGLIIRGPTPLHGGEVDSEGDHRIALAAAVAAVAASEPVRILGAEWADVSWPGFFETLRALGGTVDVEV